MRTARFVLIIAVLLITAALLLTYAVQAGGTTTVNREIEVEESVETQLWERLPVIVSVFMLVASLLVIILVALIRKHHTKETMS